MKLNRVETPEGTEIEVSGDVDLETSPALRAALLEEIRYGQLLTVNLSAVEYIDSSGIASLIETLQRSKAEQASFAIVSPSEAAGKVIALARLDRVFEIR